MFRMIEAYSKKYTAVAVSVMYGMVRYRSYHVRYEYINLITQLNRYCASVIKDVQYCIWYIWCILVTGYRRFTDRMSK